MEKVKQLFQATDMTVGVPWKQIVRFTIPMLIGNIAQQLYNTVDSIIVGKYVIKRNDRKRAEYCPIFEDRITESSRLVKGA